MEVGLCEGASWLNTDDIKSLHRVFKVYIRVDGSEGAEVPLSDQQSGGLMHGSEIQLAEERPKPKGKTQSECMAQADEVKVQPTDPSGNLAE